MTTVILDPFASHRFAANWAQDVPRLVLRVLSALLSPPTSWGASEPPGPHQADDVKWTFKCQVELQAHMASTAGSGPGGHEREMLGLSCPSCKCDASRASLARGFSKARAGWRASAVLPS